MSYYSDIVNDVIRESKVGEKSQNMMRYEELKKKYTQVLTERFPDAKHIEPIIAEWNGGELGCYLYDIEQEEGMLVVDKDNNKTFIPITELEQK